MTNVLMGILEDFYIIILMCSVVMHVFFFIWKGQFAVSCLCSVDSEDHLENLVIYFLIQFIILFSNFGCECNWFARMVGMDSFLQDLHDLMQMARIHLVIQGE